ncbi:MAG: hypothetical protein HYX26_09170 [Acidobacteriales bacterium]|nr:hypothetical protein [Terriglobales bacterium]
MTFHIHFCQTIHGAPMSADALAAWAAGFPLLRCEGQNNFHYVNKYTGVAFSIGPMALPANVPALPEGLRSTGLAFQMDARRPFYFGLEAAPLLVDLGQRFDLWAVDPGAGDSEPQFATADWFLCVWTRAHQHATLMLSRTPLQTDQYTAREEQTRVFWEYMSAYPRFSEHSAKAGFFAPRMFLMARKGATEVRTAVTLVPDVPQVLPRTDLAMVVADRSRLFRIRKEVDVFYAPMHDVLQELSPWLFEFEARPELLMLRRDDVAAAFERLQRFPYPWTHRDFHTVNPEQVVDAPALETRVA